jgi:hypothetical protein
MFFCIFPTFCSRLELLLVGNDAKARTVTVLALKFVYVSRWEARLFYV